MYREIDKLIQDYSVAWEFCGNKTSAKIKLAKELNKQLRLCIVVGQSEQLSCPNTKCPIVRYDNGESYCTKCDYMD